MTFFDRHAYDFGAAVGRFLYPFARKRRRIAVENLLKTRCAADVAEADRIARRAFGHFLGHVFEALRAPHVITREDWREHLDVSEAHPAAIKALFEETDKPILLVSGHHGVWEVATNVIPFSRPMLAIARALDNKFLAHWMEKHHFRGDVTIIDKNHFTAAAVHKWLEKKAAMTILMDQHVSPRHAVQCDFLGLPAWTVTSAARLAIATGAHVVVGSFLRIAPFRYRLVGGEPLVFGKDAAVAETVAALNARLSAVIRKYPEQYLWAHRRWRDAHKSHHAKGKKA